MLLMSQVKLISCFHGTYRVNAMPTLCHAMMRFACALHMHRQNLVLLACLYTEPFELAIKIIFQSCTMPNIVYNLCSDYLKSDRNFTDSADHNSRWIVYYFDLHIHLFSKILHQRHCVSPRQPMYLLIVGSEDEDLLSLLLVKKECSSFVWNSQGAVFFSHRSEWLWFAGCRHIFYFSQKKRHVERKKQLAQIIKTRSTAYI